LRAERTLKGNLKTRDEVEKQTFFAKSPANVNFIQEQGNA
jgi:hypothetical protein